MSRPFRTQALCRLSSLAVVAALLLGLVGVHLWTLAVVGAYAALQARDTYASTRGRTPRVAAATLIVPLPVLRVRRRAGR